LSQATFSSAVQLYENYTYGELLEWAEDVNESQPRSRPKRDEAVNVETEILNSY